MLIDIFDGYTTEQIKATVIGEITSKKPYGFFKDGKPIATYKWFENDEEAIEWFKKANPISFKKGGVEMRCYD